MAGLSQRFKFSSNRNKKKKKIPLGVGSAFQYFQIVFPHQEFFQCCVCIGLLSFRVYRYWMLNFHKIINNIIYIVNLHFLIPC